MVKAAPYAVNAVRCIDCIRKALDAANWSRKELALRTGWTADLKTLYRYLDYPDESDSVPDISFLIACLEVLGLDYYEATGIVPHVEPAASVDCDTSYIHAQLKGRRHTWSGLTWEREIAQYFAHQKLPIRVRIAPTHDFSGSPAEKLTVLGAFGAPVVEHALFKNGSNKQPHVVLQGLGKQMNSLVHAVRARHKARGRFI